MNKLLTPYKDGIYKALFYGHCLELENGDTLETDIGVRCSRIACGGWKTYKIENNTFEEIENFTEKLSETKLMKDNIREIFTNDSLYESELKNKYRKRDIRKNYFDKIYDSLTNKDKEDDVTTGVNIRLRKLSNKLKAIKASDFDKQQIEKLFLDLDESNQILSESIPGEPKTSDYYNNFSKSTIKMNTPDKYLFSEKLSDVKSKTKLPEGTFTNKATTIKKILVENSKDKNDCIKKINFYINRVGKNLKNKTEVMKAKKMIENMITFNDLTERLNAINHNLEENFSLNRFQKAIVLGTMGLGLLGGKVHCENTHINEPTKIEKVRSRRPARNFDKEYKEDKLKDLKDQLQQLKSGAPIDGKTKLRDTIIDPPEPEDISLLVKMQGGDVEKYQKEYEQKLLNYYEQVKHNQERRNQYKLEDEKDELTRKEMIKELEKQIKELEELLEKTN